MPLLLPVSMRYSAWILKSLKVCFETRLLAPFSLVMAPSTTDQPEGLLATCTPQVSSDLPSNSSTGLPCVCAALALADGHDGGRAPVNASVRSPAVVEP